MFISTGLCSAADSNLRQLILPDSIGCPAPGDSNAVDAEHSYDFYFADGTHLTGTSEHNVVEVTVDGKTFNLHISCSDPFPDGYGMKGGPVEGDNPPVVSSYLEIHGCWNSQLSS